MDFPSYVPEGVRDHALHYLGFWEPTLKDYETEIAAIKEKISYWEDSTQDSEHAQLQIIELRGSQGEVTKCRDDMARDVENIRRLVGDARMKDAYLFLTNAFFDDEHSEQQRKFDGFIQAAWSANLDFSHYREGLKKAAELRDKIAETADKLAGLLDRIGKTGVYYPSEFFSIPELLRNTDNHETQCHQWRALRGYVLGDPLQRERTENEQPEIDPAEKPEIVFKIVAMDEKPDIDPAEKARNTLRYAWEKSPSLSELLRTVSKAANEFIPREDNFIGAAIDSRQQSVKAEYLRAFGNLLTEQHRFILTTDIMKAMAIAANVVINSPDIDVTYDDVRKALAKLGGD